MTISRPETAEPVRRVPPGYLASNLETLDAARTVRYGGFWRRFAAAFIDGIVVYIVSFVAGLVMGLGLSMASVTTDTITGASALVGLAIGVLYYALQESSEAQATLGKRALGVQVTDVHGQRISFPRALARTFAKWLSAVILLLGYIMAAFTPRKRALHDFIAGTLVVRTEPKEPVS